MQSEDVQVTVYRSESGFPILRLDAPAELSWRVDDGDAGTLRHVEISGNGAGLRALGELLIGLATTPGVHDHIDAQSTTGRTQNGQGFALTVANTDPPPQRARSKLPPDWAR
jgi:hypothetical protein